MGPLSFRRPAAWTPPGVQMPVVAIDGPIVLFTWTAHLLRAGSAQTHAPLCTAEISHRRAPDIIASFAHAPQSEPLARGAPLIRRMP